MKIINIFAPHLYAIKYNNNSSDELERLFDFWADIEQLEEFFENNKKDLQYFNLSIEQAIIETTKEASDFRKHLIDVSNTNFPQLDNIFKNLNNSETRVLELSKQKSSIRWLRLYALRIDANVYLITGGAIKLTKTMEERPHTQEELNKLERCRIFLREYHVFDNDSFKEMLSENQ